MADGGGCYTPMTLEQARAVVRFTARDMCMATTGGPRWPRKVKKRARPQRGYLSGNPSPGLLAQRLHRIERRSLRRYPRYGPWQAAVSRTVRCSRLHGAYRQRQRARRRR